MKKLIFAFLCLHSAWAFAIACDPYFIQQLARGHEYEIQPTVAIRSLDNDRVWPKTEIKKLIFIGKMPRDRGADYYVFADRNRNTYYLEGRNSRANGYLVSTLLVNAESRLPEMVKQSDGSCNVCAQVMAANAARERRGLEPLPYNGSDVETDESLQQYSYFEVIRQFLQKTYEATWPNGYSPGDKPKISLITNFRNFAELNSRVRAMANLSADLKGSDLSTRKSRSALEMIEHIQNGGTAVIGGTYTLQRPHLVTSAVWGSEFEAKHSDLQPYVRRGLVQLFLDSRQRGRIGMEILERINDGQMPDESMVKDFAMNLTRVGHAVAAVGMVWEGPLMRDIVVMNSWGTVELYQPTEIRDGLRFLLIR